MESLAPGEESNPKPKHASNCKLQQNRQSHAATWRIQTKRFRRLPNYFGPCYFQYSKVWSHHYWQLPRASAYLHPAQLLLLLLVCALLRANKTALTDWHSWWMWHNTLIARAYIHRPAPSLLASSGAHQIDQNSPAGCLLSFICLHTVRHSHGGQMQA